MASRRTAVRQSDIGSGTAREIPGQGERSQDSQHPLQQSDEGADRHVDGRNGPPPQRTVQTGCRTPEGMRQPPGTVGGRRALASIGSPPGASANHDPRLVRSGWHEERRRVARHPFTTWPDQVSTRSLRSLRGRVSRGTDVDRNHPEAPLWAVAGPLLDARRTPGHQPADDSVEAGRPRLAVLRSRQPGRRGPLGSARIRDHGI